MQCKQEEIQIIIRNNIRNSPEKIAAAIISNIDYSKIPLSLLHKINNDKKNQKRNKQKQNPKKKGGVRHAKKKKYFL